MNNYIDLLFLALLLRTLINIVLIVTQNKGGHLIKALDLCDFINHILCGIKLQIITEFHLVTTKCAYKTILKLNQFLTRIATR